MFRQADRLLHGDPPDARFSTLARLALLAFLGGAFYGAVMGSFGGWEGERLWQVVFSAVKVPMLLLVTFALSLPSFFVLNTLLGVRSDFGQVFRALIASQAGLALVLASLSPFTMLWYASFRGYHEATLFNGLMFGTASVAAQWLLYRWYKPLIARQRVHLWLWRIWLVVYSFVGIQMGWVLRPFIGMLDAPVQFFRDEAWGNAYVIVAQMIWRVLTRRG